MKKLSLIIFVSLLIFSCKRNEVEPVKDQTTQTFYLKDQNGQRVSEIPAAAIQPIYEDLKKFKGNDSAAAFLNTYDKQTGKAKGVNFPDNARITIRCNGVPIKGNVHVQDYGWLNGQWIEFGTTGEGKRLEAYNLGPINKGFNPNTCQPLVSYLLTYRSHIAGIGWESSFRTNGQVSGTTGQARAIEAIIIQPTSSFNGIGYILYRSHIAGIGWESNYKTAGQVSGTTGLAKAMEAFELNAYFY